MQFKDKTAFTSQPIKIDFSPITEVYLTVTGPGPVALEQLEEDGIWRSFPETTFYGPTAQRVSLKRGQFRVAVTATEPTTVEVRI